MKVLSGQKFKVEYPKNSVIFNKIIRIDIRGRKIDILRGMLKG